MKVMERHYNALVKEMNKSKPCETKINLYLDKEFDERRRKIENMSVENRHEELFEAYPCFKNHLEVKTYFFKCIVSNVVFVFFGNSVI